ncbi:glycogen synthase [Achromobacter xylosoxidans A8]|uniref:Glycogen synthase n=1 Tax=Achromobacter xylosoxidans (strain A8) TaxID=762376 RepID=E3HFV3_ACHXA|nr:glycogen synthase GlgA [Achromobacter xylosoxidans]ADP16559.1 glycogen synthase [Achromobacter xylosoxidans A8]
MAKIRTLVVAGEAFPLAKTGGLGDAITGMARALREAGFPLMVLLPAYRGVRQRLERVRVVAPLHNLPGGEARLLAGHCAQSGLDFLLLENDALYDRPGLYLDENGCEHTDNALRYAALAHAAVRVAGGLPGIARPTLLHVHDWHAGLVPLLLREYGPRDVKSIMTIHNLAFQGQFPMECAESLGIPERYRNDEGAGAWGRLNFLKTGIRYADRVTTVSHTYAREILTPAFGCGLDALLRRRAADLVPIPNGIDNMLWNPVRDPHLGSLRYSARDLGRKARCKAALQREFGLCEDSDAVLVAMGSRLTEQKMADVAAQALPQALERHPRLQVAILGQGERRLEEALKALSARYPGRCATHIGYDEAVAHRLHAGSDVLLHGSRFEPFGLTPLYAMRYGSIPIGSRVGGMADTIDDPGPRAPLSAMAGANGLLFDGDDPAAMAAAITRALSLREDAMLWRTMQRNAMSADFSWRSAAGPYAELYRSLAEADRRTRVPAQAEAAASAAALRAGQRSSGRLPAPAV